MLSVLMEDVGFQLTASISDAASGSYTRRRQSQCVLSVGVRHTVNVDDVRSGMGRSRELVVCFNNCGILKQKYFHSQYNS